MTGMDNLPNREAIEAFVKKHKVALAIGAVIIVLMAMNDNGANQMAGGGGSQAPLYDGGGGSGGGADGGGGVDMGQWREDQRQDDGVQRDRIDAIREVERCYDPDTGQTYEVSIHVGC